MVAFSEKEVNFWVGVPQCDWLTLGSFAQPVYDGFHAWVRDLAGDKKLQYDSKVMQYVGIRHGGAFAGVATQAGKLHGLLSVGGDVAHDAVMNDFSVGIEKPFMTEKEVTTKIEIIEPRCTRVDLQLTVPLLEEYSARGLTDQLRSGHWSRKGAAPQVDVYDSADGMDTVYVGSRSSNRFWRIYVKAADEGKYLRFEVEYKGRRARKVFSIVHPDPGSIGPILLNEWSVAPDVDEKTWNSIGEVLEAYGKGLDVPVPRARVSNDRTLRWMNRVVWPVIKRQLKDHDTGPRTRRVLEDLLRGH